MWYKLENMIQALSVQYEISRAYKSELFHLLNLYSLYTTIINKKFLIPT